jgi:hypothetical protein
MVLWKQVVKPSRQSVSNWLFAASSQVSESGTESVELPESKQNSSFEAPRRRAYSLTIQNTTICSSGTYRCALQELGGQRNLSGTVVLKVTGELTSLASFSQTRVHFLQAPVSPLPESEPTA